MNSRLALQRVKNGKSKYANEVKGQFLPFNLDSALSLFANRWSHFAAFFEGKRSELNYDYQKKKKKKKSSTEQFFRTSRFSSVFFSSRCLNDSPSENQFTADSDSGE